MKIQSDGKGYGKPVNPTKKLSINAHSVFPAEDILKNNELFDAFDRDNPTLPIYLQNGEPYLGDDVVEGERGFMQSDEDAEGKTIWRRCWNPHLATSDTMDCYIVHPVVTKQAEAIPLHEEIKEIKATVAKLTTLVNELAIAVRKRFETI